MAEKRTTAGILKSDVIRQWEVPRVAPDVLKGFRDLPDLAGVVARALDQFGVNGTVPAATLPPLTAGGRVCGTALTVRSIPEREVPYRYWQRADLTLLGEREAFFLSQEGDVIVIDGSSVYPASNLGSFSAMLAKRLGIGGIVVDGCVTGVDGIRGADIPVWTKGGTTVTGHHRVETAEINGTIGICGIRVEPGDIICADDSGVTVVPNALAADVLARCNKMRGLVGPMKQMVRDGADRETLRGVLAEQMKTLAEVPKA